MMQNRAGKNFNLGRLFSEFGKASEKAMPELIAAKNEAKQNRLLAGKYALESRSKDRAKAAEAKLKAMQKSKYYIMPKSEGISGFLSIMDESKPTFLNAAEFSALVDNPDFDKEFDIITEERFAGLVEKTLESKEAVDLFGTTKSDVFLFSDDADKMFSFKVNDINPNLPEGKSPRFGKMTNPGQADQIYRGLADALSDINKFEESFAGAIADIDEGGATLQAQVQNFLIQAADRIGVEVNAETATADLKKFVTKLQAQNAAEILGEAGKTLSDKDRQLVAEIVGDLPGLLTGSPDMLKSKLLELKTRVLDNKRREILRAFQTMDNYTRNDYSELYGDAEWSDDDQTRLLELRKQQGAK
jgi:predicted RNA-binding protein Jag